LSVYKGRGWYKMQRQALLGGTLFGRWHHQHLLSPSHVERLELKTDAR
jgi:hypothetical protein